MKLNKFILCLLTAAAILPLAACERAKEELGLNRRAPDEFAVLTRAPLAMPPAEATALPPPQPGAPRPQETSPITSAQTAILGQTVPAAEQKSSAESLLLQKAGASQADPNIRAKVNQEAAEGVEDKRPVIKKLLNVGNKQDDGPATLVDAPGELQRLKTNKATGQPMTQGETPTRDD